MNRATANKVTDVLGMVENLLYDGRPRKLPGKSRPEGISFNQEPILKITKANFLSIGQVSLVGAIKLACYEEGYSKTIQKLAEQEIAGIRFPMLYAAKGIQAVDDAQFDTRQIIRDAIQARKRLEKKYGLGF